MPAFVFRVKGPIPEWEAVAGDLVVMRPGQECPLTVLHGVPPNYGRVLGLVEDGLLVPECNCTPTQAVTALARAIGEPRPLPPLLRRRRRRPPGVGLV